MWTPAAPLPVSPEQRRTLEAWTRAHNTPKMVDARARIVLHAANGWSNNAIATELKVTRTSVIEWRRRFTAEGLESLGKVRPGRGRPRSISAATVAKIVHLTLNTVPKGATHWSCRTMAKRGGGSPASLHPVWRHHRPPPPPVPPFNTSNDPH